MDRNQSSRNRTSSSPSKSIVVLPFVNMSADPDNEYFSDGITEEIINALTTIEGVKVIARTSSFAFKGKNVDVRTIGQQLGVNIVLEGSVRKVKNRVRITAQLVSTEDGSHWWSKNFDRELEDIFALQDEISLLIADQIRENFGHFEIQDHLIEAPTKNIEAYQLFLKGRFFQLKWTLPDIERGIQYYLKSIALDPFYDQPHFGAGLCYSLLGAWGHMNKEEAFRLADQYLESGKAIGKTSIAQYFGLAVHSFWGFWNYREASGHLFKALDINSRDPEPIDFLAEINRSIGDFETGLNYVNRGLLVNPLSTNAHYTKATLYYLQGLFEEALPIISDGLAIDPHFSLLLQLRLGCWIQLGRKEELMEAIRENSSFKVSQLFPQLYDLFHHEGLQDLTAVNKTIQTLQNLESPMLYPWDIYLLLYSDQEEQALLLLKSKVEQRMGQVVNFKNDPFLQPIRKHPEYLRLIQSSFPDASLNPPAAPAAKDAPKEVLSKEEIAEFSKAIQQLMEVSKVFLQADLRLKDVAETIGLHPNKLSWLLNEITGKNFNELINSYRLETFKAKAVDPANSHLTVLGLAYESGFNSKTVFNTFFKKMQGMTPKAWMKLKK